MKFPIEARNGGLVLEVRVHAGARQNSLRVTDEGCVKLSVTQIAEQGKANAAVLKLLSKMLKTKRSQVELLSGRKSPQKKILIHEMDRRLLDERLKDLWSSED